MKGTKPIETIREHVDRSRAILTLMRTDDNAGTVPFGDAVLCLESSLEELKRAVALAHQLQETGLINLSPKMDPACPQNAAFETGVLAANGERKTA